MARGTRPHARRAIEPSPEPGAGARRAWARAALGLAARPGLWPTALRQLLVVAPPGWWRRSPFLPVPDRGYLRFRRETAYGDRGAPDPDDVVRALAWSRAWQRQRRGRRRPPA